MSAQPSQPGRSQDFYALRQIDEIASRWDARADSWDQSLEDDTCHLNEDDAYRRFLRAVRRLVARRQPFCHANGVIDAGCGTGVVMARVASDFAWGMGVDISPEMIRAACAKNLANASFLVGDAFQLPSLCPPAGAVLSRGVLLSHYGREQGVALLKAARAALVPGGFVVFDFLNAAARAQYCHAPENKTWYTAREIQVLAQQAGFAAAATLGRAQRRALLLLAET